MTRQLSLLIAVSLTLLVGAIDSAEACQPGPLPEDCFCRGGTLVTVARLEGVYGAGDAADLEVVEVFGEPIWSVGDILPPETLHYPIAVGEQVLAVVTDTEDLESLGYHYIDDDDAVSCGGRVAVEAAADAMLSDTCEPEIQSAVMSYAFLPSSGACVAGPFMGCAASTPAQGAPLLIGFALLWWRRRR